MLHLGELRIDALKSGHDATLEVSDHELKKARGGKVVVISDADGIGQAGEGCLATIEMPVVHPLIAPLVYAIPVQLLAYYVTVAKGTDVDRPRNLAKSVIVE